MHPVLDLQLLMHAGKKKLELDTIVITVRIILCLCHVSPDRWENTGAGDGDTLSLFITKRYSFYLQRVCFIFRS